MKMRFGGGKAEGTVTSPPSKSHTHRAFFLGAMADGESVIRNPLMSADPVTTLNACRAMGAHVSIGDCVRIKGGNLHAPANMIDAENSGTTMRILAGILSMFGTECKITGDETLLKRPMGPLLDALRRAGVVCTSDNGRPPVSVRGPNKGGKITVDGSKSSQFVTSLLLVAPMLEKDSEITVEGRIVSEPYLDVTASMMRKFGAKIESRENVYTVRGGTGYKPAEYSVPADFSSAAFPLVAGALGGSVTVTDLDLTDPQGDRRIVDILKKCGADVRMEGGNITVGKSILKPLELDMGSTPDLFPAVAVLLSAAEGRSKMFGAPHLRLKESDRIESTVRMLNDLGVRAEETEDGCVIYGRRIIPGGTVNNRLDHRIMMSAAIASFGSESPVVMDNAECHSISYPGFIDDMKKLGMKIEVI